MRSYPVRFLAALLAVLFAATGLLSNAAQAKSFVPLIGDGSSWAEPAIDQWARDVHGQGIQIDYSPDGSATGRQHYIEDQADFAASDIAFLTTPDPFGAGIETPSYAYSYVPIVAGGTAFMYNLTVGGQKITNLRLSGGTLTKIFTGQITNWDNKAITHDYGRQLPSEKITPVTRADGAGASYMLTRWMSKQYPSEWSSFCHAHHGGGSCGPTEFYPQFTGSVQRNGSDQVASYIASSSLGAGAIGYDEYAYAKSNDIPVVKMLNAANYYTLPTASNVAIALQAAVIDENPNSPTFLMQNLDKVYTNPDPRTYPLSSYSYLIVPRNHRTINHNQTGPPPRFTDAKGATLSTWMNYVLCGAQQKSGALGYSPLPKNLVVGGFKQIDDVPGHVKTPNLHQLTHCNNPTYSDGVNHLTKDAPFPSKCDKAGAPLTCTGGASGDPNASSNNTGNNGSGGGGGGGSGTGSSGGGSGAGGSSGGGTGGGGGGKIDPDTGQSTTTGSGSGTTTGQQLAQYADPVSLNRPGGGQNWLLAGFTAADIVAVILVPGLVGAWLMRRKRAT